MASSRIIVEEAIYDKFIAAYKAAASQLSMGDLREMSTILGPIISQRQRDRVRRHIDNAVQHGATIETGGNWENNRCEPTILTGITKEMDVCYEETFGPVTSVYSVKNYDAALAMANDTPYGLSAAICTNDLNKALDFTDQVHAGMVHVNAPTLHDEPHVPFGGTGDSGFGREGVEVDVDALTEWKWITIQLPTDAPAH